MKVTNSEKPSRLLRSARRHEALTESLRSKLKTRERGLKEELAEVRKHLKKPDVKKEEEV